MKKINMPFENSNYDILIENNILDNAQSYFKEIYKGTKLFLITDDIVYDLYFNRFMKTMLTYDVTVIKIKNGEASKTIDTYQYIVKTMIENNARRGNLVVALGGGVVGDIAGFVAATLYRGLDFVNIPTTLLAMCDSSIGGKTGIDYYGMKNVLGAFKQPKLVLIDPTLLDSLTPLDYRSGLGEVIKHALIYDTPLVSMLEKNSKITEDIIYESLLVKKHFVINDEHDTNERMTLNFGHTFGHLVELEEGISHGEAVIKGMLMAIDYGTKLGITESNVKEHLISILANFGLTTTYPNYLKYLRKMVFDKKNINGVINFVLLIRFGKPMIYKIDEKVLEEFENECNS